MADNGERRRSGATRSAVTATLPTSIGISRGLAGRGLDAGVRLLFLLLATLASAAGCSDESLPPVPVDAQAPTPDAGVDAGVDPQVAAKAKFDTDVRPFYSTTCLACHSGGILGFLAPPDMYVTIANYGQVNFFVPGNPDGSRLYTYPLAPSVHSGPEMTLDQAAKVRAWILAEPP